jgi:Zn-dependent protease with chaperone function
MPELEAVGRPFLTLVVAAVLPLLTARLLAARYLRGLPPGGDERARQLAPFRRAAFLTGLGQLQLAWMAGVTALGPAWAGSPGGPRALGFGLLCATAAFMAGGIGRRVEEPPRDRSPWYAPALLRLRLVPWFVTPLVAGLAAAELPIQGGDPPTPHAGWLLVAFAACALATAYGGLLVSLLTGALRIAPAELRAMAKDVARREGAKLVLVLRLPTHRARFVNAAAIPWARTMVVTDSAQRLLSEEQLRAVLAHEAGHLTEGPRSALIRLLAATVVLFAVTVGAPLAAPFGTWGTVLSVGVPLVVALAAVISIQPHARRMEERADQRSAETVGAVPLAEALRRIHAYAQQPMVTGRRRRIHPDLHDRLHAIGVDLGPPPPPPPRGGMRMGAFILLVLVAGPVAVHQATDLQPSEIRSAAAAEARRRLWIEPWDASAMAALGWEARRSGNLKLARKRARRAARLGLSEPAYWELQAELRAAEGHCDRARELFGRALEAHARNAMEKALDEPLDLKGYALPPTLVKRCGLSGPRPGDSPTDSDKTPDGPASGPQKNEPTSP